MSAAYGCDVWTSMEIMSIPVGKKCNFCILKLLQIHVKIRIYKLTTGLDGDKSRKLKSILWTDKCQWLQTEKSKDISITFPMGNEIPWILRRKSCRQWLIPESNSADRKYISNWNEKARCHQLWSISPEATRKLTRATLHVNEENVSSKMTTLRFWFSVTFQLQCMLCQIKYRINILEYPHNRVK